MDVPIATVALRWTSTRGMYSNSTMSTGIHSFINSFISIQSINKTVPKLDLFISVIFLGGDRDKIDQP